jgi:hypothetical protein
MTYLDHVTPYQINEPKFTVSFCQWELSENPDPSAYATVSFNMTGYHPSPDGTNMGPDATPDLLADMDDFVEHVKGWFEQKYGVTLKVQLPGIGVSGEMQGSYTPPPPGS